MRYAIEEILLELTYPRLDIHVSKGVNHLLKSPFCVHPKTGKICVPFHARAVDKFNPSKVPTIKWVFFIYSVREALKIFSHGHLIIIIIL